MKRTLESFAAGFLLCLILVTSLEVFAQSGAKYNGIFNKLTVRGDITGVAANRGSGAFTTTGLAAQVYIPGATSTDVYVVTPKAATAGTLTVAGDNMACFAKTDSLCVTRVGGGSPTSGLGFNYIRVK